LVDFILTFELLYMIDGKVQLNIFLGLGTDKREKDVERERERERERDRLSSLFGAWESFIFWS